jgi:hypothetical protein
MENNDLSKEKSKKRGPKLRFIKDRHKKTQEKTQDRQKSRGR